MRLFLISALMLGLLPGIALARPRPPAANCGGPPIAHVQCLYGRVQAVDASGMDILAKRKVRTHVVFTAHTSFQTDSGSGALEGLRSGDYVCAGVSKRKHALVALTVEFNVIPFACSVPVPHGPKPKPPQPPARP